MADRMIVAERFKYRMGEVIAVGTVLCAVFLVLALILHRFPIFAWIVAAFFVLQIVGILFMVCHNCKPSTLIEYDDAVFIVYAKSGAARIPEKDIDEITYKSVFASVPVVTNVFISGGKARTGYRYDFEHKRRAGNLTIVYRVRGVKQTITVHEVLCVDDVCFEMRTMVCKRREKQ